MRVVLGCSLGGAGHLMPVVSAVRALERLGHDAVVLVPPSLAPRAGDAGVDFVVGDEPDRSVIDEIWQRLRAGPPAAVAGLIDRELFAQRACEAMVGPATALCDRVAPHLIVRESCEYATALVSQRTGIAQAQIGVSQSRIEHGVLDDVAASLDRQVPATAAAIRAAPFLTSFPESLDPSPWPDTRRYRAPTPAVRPLPDWWPGDPRPLVYVTFGSVVGRLPEGHEALRTALHAVAGLPIRVLLTVGSAVDPETLQPIPDNAHVERWVAQDDVFPAARLVVCHGGSGTVFGALGAGVPLVICPLFADQTANARLVQTAGAGLVVGAGHAPAGGVGRLVAHDAPRLREAILATLGASGHRAAAERLGRELARARTLDDLLAEMLAGGGRAVVQRP